MIMENHETITIPICSCGKSCWSYRIYLGYDPIRCDGEIHVYQPRPGVEEHYCDAHGLPEADIKPKPRQGM